MTLSSSFISDSIRDFALFNIHRSSFTILLLCALFYFPLSLAGQSCGNSITLRSQAEIDDFTATYGACTTISVLRLEGNDITNVDGLSNITDINNLFAQQVPNLENFDGFSNLKALNNLLISACPKVTNLDGFSSLTKIRAEFRLSNMANLTSIEGLRNVTRMPRFRIWQNPKLATCCLLYGFANNPATIVKVMYGNAGNCSVAQILAHPNTSTISATESDGTNNDGTICTGTTAQLTASGAFDFVWDADASLSATDIANPMVTPTEMTTYTVTARGCNNTVDTETFTVTVDEQGTTANAGPNQTKLNSGDFRLAGNTATIGSGRWTLVSGTATINSPTNPRSLVTGVPIASSATLRWTITSGACANSDEVTLFSKRDTDGDGTPDEEDDCDDRIDSDGDGISDCEDDCDDRRDKDGDGISDCKDDCDNRIDSDEDGIVDCYDICDDRIDTDGDGTSDCKDECPNDPTKIIEDECGCGEPDQIDSDGDGIVNCMDDCPYDLNQYVDGRLECGKTMKSDTRLGSRVIQNYGECSNITFDGRELFYKFTLYDAGAIKVRFKEIGRSGRELQLFIFNDLCFVENCIGTISVQPGTEESLMIEDAAAGDYYFAVDSRAYYHRAEFELTVDCGGEDSGTMVTCEEDALSSEDFEGYEAGTDIVSASDDFELFGYSSVSSNVVEMEGETPNKAIYFDRSKAASDIVFLMEKQFRGIGRIAWNMYVAPNQGATFSIFGHESTARSGLKYEIDRKDTALQGKWISIEAFIDLDNNEYTIFINNRAVVVSGSYAISLARLNFYASWNNTFYVDNLCYSKVTSVPFASRVAMAENAFLENNAKPTTASTTTTAISEFFTTDVTTTATSMKQDLTVFPNPTKGQFNYQGQLPEITKATIEIFNQLGQSVRRVSIEDTNFLDLTLDLNDLPDGIYLLQTYSDRILDTQRIVLQR